MCAARHAADAGEVLLAARPFAGGDQREREQARRGRRACRGRTSPARSNSAPGRSRRAPARRRRPRPSIGCRSVPRSPSPARPDAADGGGGEGGTEAAAAGLGGRNGVGGDGGRAAAAPGACGSGAGGSAVTRRARRHLRQWRGCCCGGRRRRLDSSESRRNVVRGCVHDHAHRSAITRPAIAMIGNDSTSSTAKAISIMGSPAACCGRMLVGCESGRKLVAVDCGVVRTGLDVFFLMWRERSCRRGRIALQRARGFRVRSRGEFNSATMAFAESKCGSSQEPHNDQNRTTPGTNLLPSINHARMSRRWYTRAFNGGSAG